MVFTTPERRRILDAVFSLHRHFDFDELYDLLKARDARVSRATIYRTLPLLIESRLIREVSGGTRGVRYEHVYGHAHHDHMLCLACGRFIEFSDERVEKAQQQVCRRFSFTPVDHTLAIRGYCKACETAPHGGK